MSSEIGKNPPSAENPAEDSPGIDSEFLAGRFMEEAQQTAPGEAFIMNPVTGETHKATVVTDLAKEAEEGGSGLRYLKPKPTPAEHEITIRNYLAAKNGNGRRSGSGSFGYGRRVNTYGRMQSANAFQKRFRVGASQPIRPRGRKRGFRAQPGRLP